MKYWDSQYKKAPWEVLKNSVGRKSRSPDVIWDQWSAQNRQVSVYCRQIPSCVKLCGLRGLGEMAHKYIFLDALAISYRHIMYFWSFSNTPITFSPPHSHRIPSPFWEEPFCFHVFCLLNLPLSDPLSLIRAACVSMAVELCTRVWATWQWLLH